MQSASILIRAEQASTDIAAEHVSSPEETHLGEESQPRLASLSLQVQEDAAAALHQDVFQQETGSPIDIHIPTGNENLARARLLLPNLHNASADDLISIESSLAALQQSPEGYEKSDGGPCSRCQVPFRAAVMAVITSSVFLSCAGMFIPLEIFTQSIRQVSLESCSRSVGFQRHLIERLMFNNVTQVSYSKLLKSMSRSITNDLVVPADRALESVWGSVLTYRAFDPSWDGANAIGRKEVAFRAWAELSSQWQTGPSPITGVSAFFSNGAYAGFRVECLEPGCEMTSASGLKGTILDAPPGSNGSQGSVIKVRSIDLMTGTSLINESISEVALPNEFASEYLAQAALAKDSSAELTKLWSAVEFSEEPQFAWTSPIAYCGNYSCFSGVLSAQVSLRQLQQSLDLLRHSLVSDFAPQAESMLLNPNMSSFFVVNQESASVPSQEGILLAASSWSNAWKSTHAVDDKGLIRTASQLLLTLHGSWNTPVLTDDESMYLLAFSRAAAEEQPPRYKACQSETTDPATDFDCFILGAQSLKLDKYSRWLALAVLPFSVFNLGPGTRQRFALQQAALMDDRFEDIVDHARETGVAVLLVMTFASVTFGFVIGVLVARPMRSLAILLDKLSELDFSHESEMVHSLLRGQKRRRAVILDVCELQNAFCRLYRAMETFSRFVPATVVRNIVKKGTSTARIQVERRMVTIMCSDIAGFTTISEDLAPRDLLFILTRYFSVMTRVVEVFGGVVSEILGDGLIVFFNAPDDVSNHAGKTCAAALAQQQALNMLNAELQYLDLPTLTIRIGIHTGSTLTGNIGSQSKMKYGCLGDTKQFAMKLEESCKAYGVGIICSAQTYDAIGESFGFLCRKLDNVQVEGQSEATSLYEVIGRECQDISDELETSGAAVMRSLTGSNQGETIVPPIYLPWCRRCLGLAKRNPSKGAKENFSQSFWERVASPLQASSPTYSDDPSPSTLDMALSTNFATSKQISKDEISPEQRRLVSLYEMALQAYDDSRFREAIELASVIRKDTDDRPAAKLLISSRWSHLVFSYITNHPSPSAAAIDDLV